MRTSSLPVRPVALGGIALTTLFASAALGAATNVLNGWISPEYFMDVLHRHRHENIWRMSIAQGLLEGLVFGVFFSLLFSGGVGIITRVSCKYGFALKHLLGVITGSLICWGIGGLATMLIATISPEVYSNMYFGRYEYFGEMLAKAWVGGSIWGLEVGGLVSMILGLVVLHANWQRRLDLGDDVTQSTMMPTN